MTEPKFYCATIRNVPLSVPVCRAYWNDDESWVDHRDQFTWERVEDSTENTLYYVWEMARMGYHITITRENRPND